MNGVDLVDVIAEPIEKLVSRKPAKAVLRGDVGEQFVELARDIRDMREARAALGGIDGAVFARPIVEFLKQVLMKRAVALGSRWKVQARGFCAARLGKSPLCLGQGCIVGDPKPIPKRVGAGIAIRVVRQG